MRDLYYDVDSHKTAYITDRYDGNHFKMEVSLNNDDGSSELFIEVANEGNYPSEAYIVLSKDNALALAEHIQNIYA